jgi:phosphoglycolate phosphatase-like HAD superfamily hydrolase
MYFEPHQYDRPIDKFTQSELNDLIRELQLTKEKSELLGSRLHEKKMLASGVKFSWYRSREKEFRKYYAQEDQLVFCKDVHNLLHQLEEKEYDPSTWRLFIDSSKRSLKAVLLHNSNVLASIPHAHSTKLSESYETLKLVLEKIKYHEHEWQICGDLKVIGLLLGQQRGYTKFSYFLCEWDSRARDKLWDTVHWPEREQLQPRS